MSDLMVHFLQQPLGHRFNCWCLFQRTEYMAFLQRVISTKAEVEKRKRRQEALDESKRTEENMKKTYYDDLHNPFKPQQLPDQSEDSLLHEILQQRLVNKLLKDNGADSDDDNPPLVVKKPVPGTDYDKVTGDVYWINRVTGEKTWTVRSILHCFCYSIFIEC